MDGDGDKTETGIVWRQYGDGDILYGVRRQLWRPVMSPTLYSTILLLYSVLYSVLYYPYSTTLTLLLPLLYYPLNILL